jgi:hypothetical protein
MPKNVHIINIKTDDVSGKPNYFYIGRSRNNNPLSNPYTFNGIHRSLAKMSFKTRDEAVNAYKTYFEKCYNKIGFEPLTNAFDKIYEHYKKGEEIYLGCFCAPLRCHGDIIAEELEKKLIKEKMKKDEKKSKT